MEADPKSAWFDLARLNRITEHLNCNYLNGGKIAALPARAHSR